jgi:LEA14-like dessication related protein
MATIELQEVELIDVNSIENRAMLKVTFLVANPGEVTVTVPVISYRLYADGSEIGSGAYSTEDVAMPGRAAFYPDAEIPLKNKLTIVMSEMSETVYNKIVSGQAVQYSATGQMTVESAWSIVELDFDTSS